MSQTQFLLFILILIPFANCFAFKAFNGLWRITNLINKIFPVLFLAILCGLYRSLGQGNNELMLIEAMQSAVALGFSVDKLTCYFLFLLGFLWMIFTFYSTRNMQLNLIKNINEFRFFTILIFSFNIVLVASKNLFTILFFYNALVILYHFFAIKFLHKKDTRMPQLFTILLYLESIILLFAIIATYKFNGFADFTKGGIMTEVNLKYAFLFLLYFAALFLSALAPFYIIYRNLNFDTLVTYILFFIGYSLSSLFTFLKLTSTLFGFTWISEIISKIGLHFFEIIFLLNIFIASIFLIFSKNLKSSFFYLFFQQFLLVIFETLILANFSKANIYLPSTSFVFSITLAFITISNFILFLNKAENKSPQGLFYQLRTNSFLFIFTIANLAGIAPAVGLLTKFFLLKIIIKQHLFISAFVCLINFVSLIIFTLKVALPLLSKEAPQRNSEDLNLIKLIESDSALILTGLLLLLALAIPLLFKIINFL